MLQQELFTGRSDAVFGGVPIRFSDSDHVPVPSPEPSAPRRNSQTDIATAGDAPVALHDDVAEYSPEMLAEFSSDMQFPYHDIEVYGIHMPVRHGSMRVPDFSILDWNKLQPAWKKIEQDQYIVRCENRRTANIEKLRKALVKRIGSGSVRASFAGVQVRVPDVSQAEGSVDTPTVCQQSHDCATVYEEGDRVDHEKSLKVVEDKWINVSAPCMPILTSVNSNQTEHQHFLADLDCPFNLLVAGPITRTQRKHIPKAQAACNKEWENTTQELHVGSAHGLRVACCCHRV